MDLLKDRLPGRDESSRLILEHLHGVGQRGGEGGGRHMRGRGGGNTVKRDLQGQQGQGEGRQCTADEDHWRRRLQATVTTLTTRVPMNLAQKWKCISDTFGLAAGAIDTRRRT